ncbi:MAG: hypothetical protein HC779_03245 [Phyllobacteriaceae bacterium]|nr:hypothetical protein [Phyllobacteriaceae bacterium]
MAPVSSPATVASSPAAVWLAVAAIGTILGLGLSGWALLGSDMLTTLTANALAWCF